MKHIKLFENAGPHISADDIRSFKKVLEFFMAEDVDAYTAAQAIEKVLYMKREEQEELYASLSTNHQNDEEDKARLLAVEIMLNK